MLNHFCGSSIFSLVGFMGGLPGVVGAVGGLLACIASSMLICCAPKSHEAGPCKFTAAGAMLLIAGILQLIMACVVVVFLIMAVTAVNENDYCSKRYSSCDKATDGCNCGLDAVSGYPEKTDGTTDYSGSYCSGYTDGLCYDDRVDYPTNGVGTRCAPNVRTSSCSGLGLRIGRVPLAISLLGLVGVRPLNPTPVSVSSQRSQLAGVQARESKTCASLSTTRARRSSRCRPFRTLCAPACPFLHHSTPILRPSTGHTRHLHGVVCGISADCRYHQMIYTIQPPPLPNPNPGPSRNLTPVLTHKLDP